MAALAVAAPPAHAAEQQSFAAGMNYAPPAVSIGQGDTLIFNNLDSLAKHDFVSTEGKFRTPLIAAGEKAKVEGAEALEVGSYNFHCTLHAWMQGVLNVGPAGTGGATPSTGTAGENPAAAASPDPFELNPPAIAERIGGGSWPLYGADIANSRDGSRFGPSPAEVQKMGVAWSFYSSHGDFTGTPVVSKSGILVAGSNDGRVYALDASTGEKLWYADTNETINASAAIEGGRVFVPVSKPGGPRIAAFELTTGKRLWSTQIDDQKTADSYGSPTVHKGRVYMGVSSLYGETGDKEVNTRGAVVALSAKTGKVVWKSYMVPEGQDGGAVWSTPAIDPKRKRLWVGTGNAYHDPAAPTTDSIVALDLGSGRIVNHYQATANDSWNAQGDPVTSPDYDFGASPQLFTGPKGEPLVGEGQKSGIYWAVNRDTMKPAWSTQTGPGTPVVGGIVGSTATDGKRIYGPNTTAGENWALGRDGKIAWLSSDGGPLHFNSTSVANGVVWTNDMSGDLIARDAALGVVLRRFPLGAPSWGGVAIAGGSVFTAIGTQSGAGYIAAFRYSKPGAKPAAKDESGRAPERVPEPARRKKASRKKKVHRHRDGRRHVHGKRRKGKKRKAAPRRPVWMPAPDHPHTGGRSGHPHPGGHKEMEGEPGGPSKPVVHRSDRFLTKPPGTKETVKLWYGPYTVAPGQDLNRVDIDLPLRNGFLVSLEPRLIRWPDMVQPSHQEAHIHHAHWFKPDPGNKEDNYFYGNAEWIFGNGDEETRGDFQPRTAAGGDKGPVYGQYFDAGPQPFIYMLHNKTATQLTAYVQLEVTFIHGNAEQNQRIHGREFRDVTGTLFGRTFDVPRQPDGDGLYESSIDYKDSADPRLKRGVIEWKSTVDGTIIGMGGHLHPGGLWVDVTNLGSKERPCATNSKYGGTHIFRSRARFRHTPWSEDFLMEVTDPGFRAPIRKGDVIRITGVYENKLHAWYDVMTHLGIYIDEKAPPAAGCNAKIVDRPRAKATQGVLSKPWGPEMDHSCGEEWGFGPCEKPVKGELKPVRTNHVEIANFRYEPGDFSSGEFGEVPTIKQGESLTFTNADQPAAIRHTVTTCPFPCNGEYVANYPFADGAWDSGTLGYDPIDGGSPNPVAQTPKDLAVGDYTYFCRIHPWMRGAFRVEPR